MVTTTVTKVIITTRQSAALSKKPRALGAFLLSMQERLSQFSLTLSQEDHEFSIPPLPLQRFKRMEAECEFNLRGS